MLRSSRYIPALAVAVRGWLVYGGTTWTRS